MGNFTCKRLFGKKEVRILTVGLDAAGKTTMLYKLKLGEVVTTIPTIGFNVETVEYKGVNFVTWDVGGRGGMRALQRHYYPNTDGIIFVVDSNDRDRISEVKQELDRIIEEDELRDTVLLVFANKQDLPNAMSVQEITEKLNLNRIRERRWYIQGSVCTDGSGLYEGLDWLSSQLVRKKAKQAMKTSANKTVEDSKKDLQTGMGILWGFYEAVKTKVFGAHTSEIDFEKK